MCVKKETRDSHSSAPTPKLNGARVVVPPLPGDRVNSTRAACHSSRQGLGETSCFRLESRQCRVPAPDPECRAASAEQEVAEIATESSRPVASVHGEPLGRRWTVLLTQQGRCRVDTTDSTRTQPSNSSLVSVEIFHRHIFNSKTHPICETEFRFKNCVHLIFFFLLFALSLCSDHKALHYYIAI